MRFPTLSTPAPAPSMPDWDPRPLDGLARSIDALFENPPEADVSPPPVVEEGSADVGSPVVQDGLTGSDQDGSDAGDAIDYFGGWEE